jgi:hypothetical protein
MKVSAITQHLLPGAAAGPRRFHMARAAGAAVLLCCLVLVYWLAAAARLSADRLISGVPPWVPAAALAAFVLAVTPSIARRSPIFAVYFFLLFIYTFFFQLGYAYYPQAAFLWGFYFGEAVLYHYQAFVFLSLATLAALFLLFHRKLYGAGRYRVRQGPGAPWAAVLFSLALALAVLVGTYLLYGQMGYQFDQQFGTKWLAFGYQTLGGVILVLYCAIRTAPALKFRVPRGAMVFALVVCLIPFVIATIRVRVRLEPVCFLAGVAAFEVLPRLGNLWRMRKKLAKWFLALGLAIWGMQMLVSYRYAGSGPAPLPLGEEITNQDYFGPSSPLVTSIALHWVHPAQVLHSDAANLLPFMDVPYIQQDIAEDAGVYWYTRSRSSAFYSLTEGYTILGDLGCLYNGLVGVLGIALWGLLASSDSALFNRFGTALVCSRLFDVVRGQSTYFIRSGYMFILPAVVLFILLTGLSPSVLRRPNRSPRLRVSRGPLEADVTAGKGPR